MNNFDKIRKKRVSDIIIALKAMYIMLCIVSIVSSKGFNLQENNIMILYISLCAILVIIIVYFSWVYYYRKDYIDNSPKIMDIVETLFLVLISIFIIMNTGVEESYNKLVCIFVVLIGAIQFGREYSLRVATFSSISILIIDFLASFAKYEINSPKFKSMLMENFQNDIVLISALFMTAFILGMYVDTEREHRKELEDIANKDELTGLFNHRYFQEYLNQMLIKSEKNNTEVSLLFMDIDYFKNYNDINGHQDGDLLLKQIGKILKQNIRKKDVVARYGGEEFAVILPDTSEHEAVKIGERIRLAIQNTNFKGQENQPNKNVTMSIGVSSYPTRAISKHQLLNTADDALYRAKSFNKNRVEAYHSVFDDLCRQINVEDKSIRSLRTFINRINIKDRYTYAHTERVVIYVKWFAKTLNLSEEDQVKIQIAAYLHDIGKLEIPASILNKKEKLEDDEFKMLRNHPQMGIDLIDDMKELEPFIPLVKHHHERYDGRGYPDGLKGEEIPYLARMLTIADSFDAMTSNRPYNMQKTHKEGIEELKKNVGTQFDPELVDVFIETLKRYKDNF